MEWACEDLSVPQLNISVALWCPNGCQCANGFHMFLFPTTPHNKSTRQQWWRHTGNSYHFNTFALVCWKHCVCACMSPSAFKPKRFGARHNFSDYFPQGLFHENNSLEMILGKIAICSCKKFSVIRSLNSAFHKKHAHVGYCCRPFPHTIPFPSFTDVPKDKAGREPQL